MARKNPARLEFDALSIEGGLFPAEWLAKVAATEASAQTPADYGVPKGLALRDEIGRYWRIAQALWRDFDLTRGTTAGAEGVLASRAFLRQFLHDVLGFTDLTDGSVHEIDGRRFAPGFEGLGGRVPIFVGAPAEGLDDSVSRHGDEHRRRSAFGALQEYLNATETALWGLAGNGTTLRLVRDNASLTRPAWIEADLTRVFAEERYADFAAFWLLAHASRFGRTVAPASDCVLEQWRGECQQQGSRAREALRNGVEAAILALGQGFLAHPANRTLRQHLADGTLTKDAYFNELLRCVYRMIFLLTIEERELLFRPDASDEAKRLYAEGYGMRRLRERAVRRSQHDRHGDLWASLRPVIMGLGGPDGDQILGIPGLGGLFAPDQCPHLDSASLQNQALLGAVYHLAWIREREGGTLARVNWKDMGPEELGSVYESLLELAPELSGDNYSFTLRHELDEGGNTRRKTGSYYTPDNIVQGLLDQTLEPVVSDMLALNPQTQATALLGLTVVDPACGSGHFLLAAARRLAGHLARARTGGTPTASEYRHALRDVVSHCIYGVDRNPMAVELARMALWLEAYTPDCALGFLDHHLVCGDALLGVLRLEELKKGISEAAFSALKCDDPAVLKSLAKANRSGLKDLERRTSGGQLSLPLGTHSLGQAFGELELLDDTGVSAVEKKRRIWERLSDEVETHPVALAADIFSAAFLISADRLNRRGIIPESAKDLLPTTGLLVLALEGILSSQGRPAMLAREICRDARVIHWPLVFPQIFAKGGFDVVVGNPPYISAMDLSRTLVNREKDLWRTVFESASGAYDLYVLFMELSLRLVRSGGRVGLVTPNKYLSAPYAESFRDYVFTHHRVASILDVSASQSFDDASVYPLISTFIAGPTSDMSSAPIKVLRSGVSVDFDAALLGALPDKIWGFLLSDRIDVLQRILANSTPLHEVAQVNASTTASEADTYGAHLIEGNGSSDRPERAWPTVNTGLLDPYVNLWGRASFTHQGERFNYPLLPDGPYISENRRAQYSSRKVIIAKMAKRLEATPDFKGEVAALNAAFVYAPRNGFSLEAICAILNSAVMSWIYQRYFGALAMSGGYFQFQAPQLRALPIPLLSGVSPGSNQTTGASPGELGAVSSRNCLAQTEYQALHCILTSQSALHRRSLHDLITSLVPMLLAATERLFDLRMLFLNDVREAVGPIRVDKLSPLWQPGRLKKERDAEQVLGSLVRRRLELDEAPGRLLPEQWNWCIVALLGRSNETSRLMKVFTSARSEHLDATGQIGMLSVLIEHAVARMYGIWLDEIDIPPFVPEL